MAKKRKTLPKDFDKLIKNGDINELKNVFDNCEINAYTRYYKTTALSYEGIPDEFAKWLVEKGADINAKDISGYTPLMNQIRYRKSNIKLFLDLGSDINIKNKYGDTPLHLAVKHGRVEAVRLLIEYGDNPNKDLDKNETPLEEGLEYCTNAQITTMAEIADILLEAGAEITDHMKTYVEEIGKRFELYRDSFNKDYLEETDAALTHLYELFHVVPVPRLNKHDGISMIRVKSEGWRKQHTELWNFLVPGRGHAKTVQGEVIRISGKVAHELLDNGGMNWDNDYRIMLDSFIKYVRSGVSLSEDEISEAAESAKNILNASDNEKKVEKLSELAVQWVLKNPEPILIEKVEYNR